MAEGNRLPIEYTIAWSSWALWTIEDSYAIKYFMGYFLDNHWGLVSLKSSLIKLLGVEAAN